MTKCLTGRVERGFGLAADSLAPLYQAIRERSGIDVVEGTLNVRLESPFVVVPDIILEGREYQHHETILLQRCRVSGIPALLLRTSTQAVGESHSLDVVEILCDRKLRSSKVLRDGDVVVIEVERAV